MQIVVPKRVQTQFNKLDFIDRSIILNKMHLICAFIEKSSTADQLLEISNDIQNVSISLETISQIKDLKSRLDIPGTAVVFRVNFNRHDLGIIVDGSICTLVYFVHERYSIGKR